VTALTGTLVEEPVSSGGVTRYELVDWATLFGVVAGVTGRSGGFDLGLGSQDPMATVLERWRTLAGELGGRFRSVVVSRQVHGTALDTYGELPSGLIVRDGLDGHLTSEAGVLLSISVADCIPVYLVEPRSGWLGLLHAGWRGVAAGIVETGVLRLAELASVGVEDVVMHCGIGICGECYEVGPEVHHAVKGVELESPAAMDLRAELVARARSLRLRRVSVSAHCTAHGGPAFYSHRASGGAAGRMVAYLGRPMP